MRIKLGDRSISEVRPGLIRAIATDTVRNQYDFHFHIHKRFIAGKAGNFDELNDYIYSEYFSDPALRSMVGAKRGDV